MTAIQVTLVTAEYRGDHSADVRLAHVAEPGETVEHLVNRLFELGEFQRQWQNSKPAASVIELRYVNGTQDDTPVPAEAPF